MTILVLGRPWVLGCKDAWGFTRAFRKRGIELVTADDSFPIDGDITELLRNCKEKPVLALQPHMDLAFLPRGLTTSYVPTVCFQYDTLVYAHRRICWSMLFDLTVVFHPGIAEQFHEEGNPAVMALTHAAARDLFDARQHRDLEVGWVGRLDMPIYRTRRRIVRNLSQTFRMNDVKGIFSPEEMADIYNRSRVVVNVGGDHNPQDANMRVFEAMAAGALLITSLPSELTQMGFEEGTHFVGYREEAEIIPLVRRYLACEDARRRIADAARLKVLAQHTYDLQVDRLLSWAAQDGPRFLAPARSWPDAQVRLAYLDFYAGHRCLAPAGEELRKIMWRSLPAAARGAYLIARGWGSTYKSRLLATIARNA